MDRIKGNIKISISLSKELDRALSTMGIRRGMNKSRLIETLLRENSDIKRFVNAIRLEEGGAFTGKTRGSHSSEKKDKESNPKTVKEETMSP
ncbi:MAG: ribbon-helix-helix protein, CopG family [Thermoplasmataceae archaeon]